MKPVLMVMLLVSACGAQRPPACPTPAVRNPPECAATWADARARCTAASPCPVSTGLSCIYAGAGDLAGDCLAAGVAQCQPDAGWVCAQ